MIFLVILLGGLHGLVLLPVLLSLSTKCQQPSSKSTRSSGLSTPTLCYTVNHGFTPDVITTNMSTPDTNVSKSSPKSSSPPSEHCHHHAHHSRSKKSRTNMVDSTTDVSRWIDKEVSNQKLSYVMSGFIDEIATTVINTNGNLERNRKNEKTKAPHKSKGDRDRYVHRSSFPQDHHVRNHSFLLQS
jgi:hypothetical protein